jgi:hypothetical protein
MQPDAFTECNPLDEDQDEIEMDSEVNRALSETTPASSGIGGVHVTVITGDNWFAGRLKLKVTWSTEQSPWEELSDMKEDYASMMARYLVDANVTTRSQRGNHMQAWARKTLWDISRTARRMAKLYEFLVDENQEVYAIRWATKNASKKKTNKYDPKPQFKYGVQVPRTIKQAMEFDLMNDNTLWQDSFKLEIKALTDLECFEFKDPSYECGSDYQRMTLTMIFGVKQDLRHKSRLVAGGGHLVDSMDHDNTPLWLRE